MNKLTVYNDDGPPYKDKNDDGPPYNGDILILKLNRMIDEFEGSLAKKRGEMANMDGTIALVTPIPHAQNHILIHILFGYLIAIIGHRNKSAVQQFRLYQKIYENLGKPS
jgi:hypothetical protein